MSCVGVDEAVDEREEIEVQLTVPLIRLAKDIRRSSRQLGRRQARWLVDTYYQMQDGRIRSGHQLRKQFEDAEPNDLVDWVFRSWKCFEGAVKAALGEFAAEYKVGQWMQSQTGIGPVLSAALLTYFDIRKAPTVGHMWRFAGFDPTCRWEKGQKRPWCAMLKSICAFRMGEVFVKFQNHKDCYYGHLFAAKKAALVLANESGQYAERAAAELARVQVDKALWRKMEKTSRVEHWTAGRLCPQHIHESARRWAVKLMLSHLHEVMYWDYHNAAPPAPYIFEHPELGDHRHKLEPQLWPGEYGGKLLREMGE